ncbi:amino acid adenylation domain-containing protein, partial [Nakamurella sp.]|uniref:amino acid adenylation domain-containing protein n=1 Tax=Nakamurella sp. TaxID=1869182 RepID=UPI003B3BB1CB
DPAAAGHPADDHSDGAAAIRARLLRQRLAGRTAAAVTEPAAGRAGPPRPAHLPLSAGQRQMWFLSRLEPDSWEYAAPLVLRLAGPLDVGRLRAAIDAVVARHEILRTRYRLVDHRPEQVVDPAGPVAFEFVAVGDTPGAGAGSGARAADLAYRFCGRPFDLERDWPIRVQLVAVGPDEHLLTVLFHHIACDDWSIRVFLADLHDAYRGRRPAPLPVQWADHAAAEAGRDHGADLAFWRSELADLTPLELPADRPRPARRDWHGAGEEFTVPPAVAAAVTDLARRTDTTPFMVLLSAFQVLLARYTGRTDIPVGTVVSTRNRPELQELIGYGINSLVLRGRWSGDPTFRDLLTANRSRAGAAFAHVGVPFAQLVDDLQPERDLSRTPLFQVAFAMQESRRAAFDLPGLDVTPAGAESPVARFDLTLQLEWDAARPAGVLEYATALFDRSTIRRMVGHLQRLLAAVTADPGLRLSAVPLLDEAELARLVPPHAPVDNEPVPACLHHLWRDRVGTRPDAPAVVIDGVDGAPATRLTYAELNARANRLAHHLRGLGAGPESIVGVCLTRGPALVPALLGVLKADAAYLPLDPAQPGDRLAYMVADARARIIVTTSDLRPRLGSVGAGVVVVLLDRLLWQDEPADDPVSRARPDNLAYVIYTSGSTGRPKGVCVTHANVVRLLNRGRELYGFTDRDVWPLFHSYAFDVSVWELWGALLFGGTLVVVPAAVTRSPDDFLDLLVRHRVTMLNQTPTAFRGLVALAGAGDDRIDRLAVRAVVFAGEKLDFADLAPWVARRDLATTRLANMYGITETTVHSSYYATRPADLAAPQGNPVGEPLDDLRIYLLDPAGRPVPTGVPGEIHVGGPGVTRGYLNRPDLTAARFVPDPFGAPGGRLYRSGDLAHRGPDGGLHFDGRIDDQVKIRGFRIELAEIQLAIAAHPEVAEAVVVVREPAPGDRRLVAYLVPRDGHRPDPAALRAELARTLPEYMIPSAFVGLAALPLTTNGKLDKRALPAPDRADTAASGFVAPRTDLERELAQVWREVLEVPLVGATDGFFDLGGDSIRAVALAGALSAAGRPVSVRDLFAHRTVAELAAHLTGAATRAPGSVPGGPDRPAGAIVPPVAPFALLDADERDLLPPEVVDAYPVAQAQLGMLVSMLADDERHPYHNVTSFRILDDRPVSGAALRAAAAELTRRHEVLRTGFDLDGFRRPLQLVYASASLPVRVHDLSGLDGDAVCAALRAFQTAERADVFDVRTPALLRIAAHGGDAGAWWLSVTECHPILEGWSHHSLVMELLGLYRQLRDGGTPEPVTAPAVRFADFVAAELAALDSPADREYWERVAAVPKFSLPAGWGDPDPAADPLTESYVVAVPVHDLDPALRRLARAAGASLKAVMLAAHLTVLGQLTPEPRFTAGLVCDGRPEVAGADRVYGMYINTLPFVHDRTARTWRALVRQVLDREIELWPHRRFPLPAIQRAVGADALVDVYFNYQDFRQLDAGLIDHPATLDDSVTEFGLSVSSRGGHIHLTAHPGTLHRTGAERILGMYRAVLEAMADDPDGDARAVRLPAAERAAALRGLAAGADPVVAPSVPAAFAAQVDRTPDAPAVHCGDHTLTYRELAARAGDLAGRLTVLGAGPERLVAVCLDRGPALVPALLGVLASGSAYLPIEPTLPPERIAFLLADAGVAALVTDPANAAALAPLLPGRLVTIDPDAPVAGDTLFTVPDLDPDALAYVMYTSGSTGAPKGVMATHANVLRFLAAAGDRFGFGSTDVWAAAHSFAFDVSVWEIFGALLVGGRVAVLPWTTVRSPDDLLDALVRHGVTVLDQTPSAFRGLVQLAAQDDPRVDRLALRTVLLAGERPAPAELTPWTERHGWQRPRLFNLYGITETTVESAAQQFEPADVTSGLNRAGHPFAGIGMVVLDRAGEPVPTGVPGEIHLAGHGLARGYLGRPDLTATRFVPNPFGSPGSRLYRSGDLGRLLPDGTLEVLGRIDDQVKIRGYRIEPGEIAAQVRRCPGVRDAVVTVHDGDVLMATVVRDPDAPVNEDGTDALDAATVVRWCADRLPEYMVPAAVTFRDVLPLTATGKIDRSALDAPDRAAMPALRAAVAARTDVEARLVQVWRDVLDLPEIGVEDSFFQLGGDSIRVLTLVTRMRAAGFPATVRDVFEQQTVAGLAERLTGRPAPADLVPVAPFALLSAADRSRLPGGLTDAYPLSQVQLGMVVQTLTDGDVNAYQSVNSFLVQDEPWVEGAFRAAVADLPTRHETLRTSIDLTGYSVPVQLVHATCAVPIRIVDLRQVDADGQRRALEAFVAEQGRELFDLAVAPLTRFTVHRLTDDRWRLTFTQSHAITEGWSYHRMLMELLADYRDRRDGRVPEHPRPPAVRYADFIAAELAALDSPDDRAFWADLVAEHPRLELPATWRPRRPVVPEMILGGVRLESVEAGLRALAVRARVSMKAVFLAAHLKVLSQLTAQDRFCTGLVWDTRPEAEGSDRVLGMHLNTLPFPASRPTGSWTELVRRVFADELSAFAHRRLPLPAIQRQAGGSPLLSVIFTYLDFHVARGEAVDLDATIANSPTEFDLNVTTLGGLLGLSSTTAVIGRADMDRLSDMYRAVLEAMAADPDGDAGAVYLPAGEREKLLYDWNPASRNPAPAPALLHERFAAVAATRPDATAVVCGSDRRSYAQVNAQANRLAHHLRARGVVPDELVAVSVARGADLLPIVLGVLKSGAGYLPIDPATPADRRAFMLADSGARLLITDRDTDSDTDTDGDTDSDTDTDPIDSAVTVLRWGTETVAAALDGEPETDPVAVATPDNLIYAIYTSGSTGRPKGVLLTHANVDALFAATRDRLGMGPDDVWTLFHSYAFDVSVWEMWGALRHGGTLVVVPADVTRNPDAFLDLLVAERVTVLSQTPSAFRSLVAAAADGDPRIDRLALRAVVFGGERLDFAALRPWVRRVGLDRPVLLNLYGITETTVHSSYHRVVDADLDTPEISRVGLPLPGWTMHVLDPNGQPVPIGVPGEIHVGGAGLACGYLSRPALTADRFGPDPFAAEPGGRLYRSGDIGRRLADGTIESLGRADDQVKIRGYRVELGEIAAALADLPGVADAVVLLLEQSLVGYVVPAPGADLHPADLQDRVRRGLPEYMVPAALVTVPRLPTTTNGKLDKAALPRPGFDALARRTPFVAPRTPLEQQLAAGWTAALGLDRVGVDDSFFDVGGDSLRAVALVGALRAAGLDLDVRDVFALQTIGRLAAELRARAGGPGVPVPETPAPVAPFALLDPADRERLPADVVDAYPATAAQIGMTVEAQAGPDRSMYTIVASFRIRDERPVDPDALSHAVSDLVARHEVLRTSVHLTGYTVPLQLVHAAATVPVRVVPDTVGSAAGLAVGSGGDGPDLAGFAAAERAAGLDLDRAPLLRVTAHQDRQAWWLTLTVSHLVVGGWDLNSLLAGVVAGYHRHAGSAPDADPAAGPAPAVRFADFVAAERAALADPAERAHWRDLVVDHPPVRLPDAWAAAGTGPAGRVTRHAAVSYRDLDAALRSLAARCGTSVKAVLHAAHLKVLSQLTELDEFCSGLVADARPEAAGAERVLGMYINTLPFPHRTGARTWADLVRSVFAAELAIWPHRRYPLAAITAAAGHAGQGPLLEVLFDFNDFHQIDDDLVDVGADPAASGAAGAVTDAAEDGAVATEFPLTVSTVGGLIHLAAAADRIGAPALERLAATYRAVLEAIAADPDGDARATFLTPAERARVVREWPPGDRVEPAGTTAPAAFAAQVAATPTATALRFPGGAWSYAELDERAARIAGGLAARGIGAGAMVGVLLDRGPDLVAALLGIWRAGAAFVPLDPAHPAGRLAGMLADVRAEALIADRTEDLGVPAVTVAELSAPAPAGRGTVPDPVPDPGPDPDLPAYVIFTSGSTGRPKGVLTSHRNLWAYLHPWATGLATRGPGGAPLFSSPAVDFSMTVLWGPLCTGRVLTLAPAELELADLGGWLAAAGPFGFVSLTPAHLHLLDEQIGAVAAAAAAPVYLVGGEALPADLAARWSAALGDGGLVNEYGPTEITVANSAFALPVGEPAGRIPIGRPLPGTTAYVLDAAMQPVPAGAPGEIWVGGPGVAIGYAGRPGLTADRFRPDPFGPPGTRLYRTGDLGRWLPGGLLDCLGRADEQVTVRGHRVEPGEIRAVLIEAGARDAAVLVRDGRLTAWVVGPIDPADLRASCARQLPAPMIPAAFVPVDALPITPNGKLDHRALPAPADAAGGPSAPPEGPTEQFLARVWSGRLGAEIGRDDDFFDRGGDSLSAVGLVGDLRAAGYAVTVRDLFLRRTVRALAAGLEPAAAPDPAAVDPFALLDPDDRAALPGGLTDAYPMTQVQLGMVAEMVASRAADGRAAYHSVLAHRIRADRPLDPDALQAAVDLVLGRHDTLRTSFALSGFSVPLQLVHERVTLPVTVVDGRGLDAATARRRLEEHLAAEGSAPLDPARAPQLRLTAHLEDDRTWWLTIAISHAVTEGWSLRLLVEELLDTYAQVRDGAPASPPAAPGVRYADFVAAELAALADPDDAAFWRGVTADYPAARVPAGWQDDGPATPSRARVDLAGRIDRLRDVARETGVPLKAVLHAIHLKVIGQLTGDAAYASGLVCDTRPELAGADRMLGMFLNTVPFGHDRITGSWRELARRVFDREVRLWPHRRYPLPAIQREAGRRVVEILFNYQDLDRPAAARAAAIEESTAAGPAPAVTSTLGEGATEFPLSVIASPDAFELISDSTVLGRHALDRVAGMIDAAVDALLADPDASSARPCLPAAERDPSAGPAHSGVVHPAGG